MANYSIALTHTAEKQLRKLPKKELPRIVQALEMLSFTPLPQGRRKLSGHSNTFRVRVGIYRIIYEILGQRLIIKILKIGHRKDVYR